MPFPLHFARRPIRRMCDLKVKKGKVSHQTAKRRTKSRIIEVVSSGIHGRVGVSIERGWDILVQTLD